MLHKKRKTGTLQFDREKKIPVIKSSICTGEQVAGFKDRTAGTMEEVMCIRTDEDLNQFCVRYGIRRDEIRREW